MPKAKRKSREINARCASERKGVKIGGADEKVRLSMLWMVPRIKEPKTWKGVRETRAEANKDRSRKTAAESQREDVV